MRAVNGVVIYEFDSCSFDIIILSLYKDSIGTSSRQDGKVRTMDIRKVEGLCNSAISDIQVILLQTDRRRVAPSISLWIVCIGCPKHAVRL